jgi:hypothetical protein
MNERIVLRRDIETVLIAGDRIIYNSELVLFSPPGRLIILRDPNAHRLKTIVLSLSRTL